LLLDLRAIVVVILSEAKLQRSPESFGLGLAFNL
jgi:hypothetical protein